MRFFKVFAALAILAILSGCGSSKFRTYRGPEVTMVHVDKGQRIMRLLHNDKVLKTYRFDLGFAPVGHKEFEGDGKTPEGVYFIDRRNPDSKYHLSLGISYPNEADVAYALSQGKKPGGDIFIHGQGPLYANMKNRRPDWTWGCISVSDDEIEEIYSMIRTGTRIVITP
ncbi:L,D-transpeptidase family protein [Oceaniglobus roseus]|uniref:L,D-transpeptidase family protein n=1 Tax=Oceaniglobus roseus TaxID=1737570 RepID=UPI000C7EE9FE|nr:L,D-transpeptidase family protein [Kandeliimicrobium roseum]